MLALGVMCEPNNGEFTPLSKDNGKELAHWKPSVIQQASLKRKPKEEPESTPTEDVSQELPNDEYSNAKNLILGKLHL
jgi:hypothetical protein